MGQDSEDAQRTDLMFVSQLKKRRLTFLALGVTKKQLTFMATLPPPIMEADDRSVLEGYFPFGGPPCPLP